VQEGAAIESKGAAIAGGFSAVGNILGNPASYEG
jgi:hypothetical protein